jgi:hypothetical protein
MGIFAFATIAVGLSPIRTLVQKTAVGECLIDFDRYRQSACGRVTALTFIQGLHTASAAISDIQRPIRTSSLQP